MKINTKLWLITIAALFMGIAVVTTAYISTTSIKSSIDEEAISSSITKGMGELQVITGEFVTQPTQRVKSQWKTRHASLLQLADTSKFKDTQDQRHLSSICKRLENIKVFFEQLQQHLEGKSPATEESSIYKNIKRAMLDRLLIETQTTADESFKLAGHQRAALQKTNHYLNRLMISLAAMFSIVIIIISLLVRKSIIKPVETLTRTIRIIQSGDQSNQLDVSGSDEISALARAFNDMTSRLQQTTISRDELEQHVQQRTAELKKTIAIAEQASQAKSEFLSRMSHELRTPLNAILGFAQLLDLNITTKYQKDSVNEILNAGYHLLALINEVLDLEKIDSGNIQIDLESIQLGQLISDCLSLTAKIAAQKNIKIFYTATEAYALADRLRTKQVLLNLLSNAIKYNSKSGEIHITVTQNKSTIRVEIRDTGHGIPADKAELIFAPFERLYLDEFKVDGTGIGLTISRQLMQLMHGSINFTSQPGSGSTFWIELPADTR